MATTPIHPVGVLRAGLGKLKHNIGLLKAVEIDVWRRSAEKFCIKKVIFLYFLYYVCNEDVTKKINKYRNKKNECLTHFYVTHKRSRFSY